MIFVDFFVSGAVYFSEPITRIYRAAASRPRGGVAGFLVSLVTEILLSQNIWSIIGESMESNCSIIEKIPPKGESFSDFIATFTMSVGFDTYFDLQH